MIRYVSVCVFVCERERESVCACVCVCVKVVKQDLRMAPISKLVISQTTLKSSSLEHSAARVSDSIPDIQPRIVSSSISLLYKPNTHTHKVHCHESLSISLRPLNVQSDYFF